MCAYICMDTFMQILFLKPSFEKLIIKNFSDTESLWSVILTSYMYKQNMCIRLT